MATSSPHAAAAAAAAFADQDLVTRDLQLAGWSLETSHSTGKRYWWNSKSGRRYWFLRKGWGTATVQDPRTHKSTKVYCHILTGKKLPRPPFGRPSSPAYTAAPGSVATKKHKRTATQPRQVAAPAAAPTPTPTPTRRRRPCLLYTSDAADE